MRWLSLIVFCFLSLCLQYEYAANDTTDNQNEDQVVSDDVEIEVEEDQDIDNEPDEIDDSDIDDDEGDVDDTVDDNNANDDEDDDEAATKVPKVPEKIDRVEKMQVDDEANEQFGIDTVDLENPAGNWLYKRIWWEKAEALYGKIKASVASIMDGRMRFFEARVNLDKALFDPFYLSLGLTRGELQEVTALMVEKLQETDEARDESEQRQSEVVDILQDEQKQVEKLQKTVDVISKIDHAVDDAIKILMDQVNESRAYEQEAWENLRAISRELSDKAARDHYYTMDTIWQNVKNVQQYIDGPFASYFNQLQEEAKEKTDKITQHINKLKEKGVDLKTIVESGFEEPEQETQEVDIELEEDDEEAVPMGWLAWITSIVWWPIQKVIDLWHAVFG